MRSRGSRALLLILAVALVARLGAIVATPDFRPIFDAAHYDRLGDAIANGRGYTGQFDPATPSAFRPPLYPVALAGVHLLGGGWTAERVLSALLGVATVLLVFLVADRLWGRRVGLVAAGIAAIFPPLVALSAAILSESVFIPLTLGVLLSTLEYRRTRRLRWAVIAGVLCGLAALTRVNGLLLVLAAGAGVWVARPRLRRASLVPPLAVALAAAVTVTPWMIRNAIEFNRFVGISTQSGYALGATYNPSSGRLHPAGKPTQTFRVPAFRDLYYRGPLEEGIRSSRLSHRAVDYAVDHPGYVAKTLFWNTLRVLDIHHDDDYKANFQAGYLQALGDGRLASPVMPAAVYVLLALAVLGAATQVGLLHARRAPAFVWAFPILLILPAIPAYGLSRYRAPIDPFLAMLAAIALVAVYERVFARERPAPSAPPRALSAARAGPPAP